MRNQLKKLRQKPNLNNQSLLVRDKPVKESLAGFFDVDIITIPSVKGGILEGTSEAESDGPGEGAVIDDGC